MRAGCDGWRNLERRQPAVEESAKKRYAECRMIWMPGNAHGGESNPKCTMTAKLNTLKSVW